MARMHPHEGRRARAAIQVLVAAADGEVGPRRVQVDRHGAGAVRQVPDRQRAGRMGSRRDGGHVVHGAGAVVHVREQQHCDVGVECGVDAVRLHQPQLAAALAAQACAM
jgi:hypothetical protein